MCENMHLYVRTLYMYTHTCTYVHVHLPLFLSFFSVSFLLPIYSEPEREERRNQVRQWVAQDRVEEGKKDQE